MIELPKELLTAIGPYPPDVGRMYWLSGPLLDPDDQKPKRPAVVLQVPDQNPGDIVIATRSTSDKRGQRHPRQSHHGLNKDGWFSHLGTRSTELWTPEYAVSMELFVDDVTMAYIFMDFGL